MKTQTILNSQMTPYPFFGQTANSTSTNPHEREGAVKLTNKTATLAGTLGKAAVIALSALALLTCAISVQAQNLVVNGGFEATTGQTSSFVMSPGTGGPFAPDDWTFSGGIGCVTFPASTLSQSNACGQGFASLYPGWTKSPDGGNFVLIDGDPSFSGKLSQSISVTQGQSYQVSFDQAAAQFQFYSGATTELWQVCLGSTCQNSTLMNNASHGFVPWESQTLTFTADKTGNEMLSFLAVGTPDGEPPVVLLDGVSVEAAATPEPGTLALSLGGLFSVMGAFRSKRWFQP